jgi:Bacterial regulatory helix-turn-helix protein, lysR family
MDLKHLQTFVAVVEYGTVSKAAVRLNTAQPALPGGSSTSNKNWGSRFSTALGAACA